MLQFGKSLKGKVIHVVVLEKTALCDKKQMGLVVDKSLGPKDVTCAKCKGYKVFKEVLADQIANDAIIAAETVKKDKKKEKKKEETISAKKLTMDFYKEKKTDGTFQIIHTPSGLHFFDKIEEKVVGRALSQLNKIEIRWEIGSDKPPKGFVSRCRKALRIAYKQSGIEIPDILEKKKDPVEDVKKEKVIKKKDKKKGNKKEEGKKESKKARVIKRRDKKAKKETKPKKKSKKQIAYEFIAEQMVSGISISKLISLLVKKFDLSAKKANSKVKGNIRRMRKDGIEIIIRLTEKKENDFYKIVN